MVIYYRAVLIFGLMVYLTVSGQIPWWVLATILLYNIPGSYRFLLPSQKRSIQKQIEGLIQQQQDAKWGSLTPKDAREIN